MGRARVRASELIKLLNSSDQPIYAIDDEQTLVFCNQACLDWVGYSSEEMLGLRCVYQTSPEVTGADVAAAALCPPPEAFLGQEMRGTICLSDRSGCLRHRRAHYLPVAGAMDLEAIGQLVLIDREDLPETDLAAPAPGESESQWLHQRIQRYRHQAVAHLRPDRLLGDSPAMRRVRAQLALAAGISASVLVIGAAGSGRQRVAQTIHYSDPNQPAGTMIPLACSLLGSELVESAIRAVAERRLEGDRPGTGTLLLNDVDQLPADVQNNVADALGAKSFPLRVIGTARQPLDELARNGGYDADLAALVGTIVIQLPRLADRREDLPLLAQAFMEEVNGRSAKQVSGFSSEALDWLDGYDWPGNVDELAQLVAKAHERADGAVIEVSDLPQRIHLARKDAAHPVRVEERIVLDDFLDRVQRELIVRALRQAKGNKTKAASLLGMTRPRFYRRLVQLGLEEEGNGGRGRRKGGSEES